MPNTEALANNPRLQIEKLQAGYASLASDHVLLQQRFDEIKRQLDWFKRELFGPKSERREIHPDQLALFESLLEGLPASPEESTEVPAHTRCKKRSDSDVNDTGLRFTDEVPLEVVELSVPELKGPDADQYTIIDYRESYRLASEPGSHVVICYKRPVVARKDGSGVVEAPAPVGPLGHATADASFLAYMLIDKFAYHTPLYRQHQKLQHEGITLSRASLDNWTHSAIDLLKPLAQAVMDGVLGGGHIKIDETPVKAGRGKDKKGRGKMKQAWFWPILGESGDIVFHFSPSRGKQVLVDLLDERFKGTVQTDGYDVYARYAAARAGIIHALCWAHTRRTFLKAEDSEPQATRQILALIAVLYRIEKQLRKSGADDEEILETRRRRSRRCVDKIFNWIKEQRQNPGLLPKSPLAKALNYAAEREVGLRVFLDDAWVALDTNDLERGLRVIPMGKKNWLFCSSEVGAEHVAIIQTLLATCKAHGINPFNYLVDVLQRIDQHPASRVHELTPREWQKRFSDNPLRSPLHEIRKTA
jgi:transposase